MSPNYKLTYFCTRGRAETIRLLFAAGGLKYEDHRLDGASWPALKPKTPFGTLPILEIDGHETLGQSIAIARFVAKEAGLYGASNYEAAYIDSLVDMITDLRENYLSIKYVKDAVKKEAAYKEANAKCIPDFLCKIEKFLGSNNYLSKNKVSFADVHFFSVMELVQECKVARCDECVFKNHKKAEALFDRIKKCEKIAAYLKTRPADAS